MARKPNRKSPKRVRCYTRALKNARYLQRNGPAALRQRKDAVGFGTGVPIALLQRLHSIRQDSAAVAHHPAVFRFLKRNTIPKVGARPLSTPPFSGTIHFVQVAFQTPTGEFTFSTADMTTMVGYAKHAIVPISQMICQYGSSSVSISAKLLRFTARMSSRRFSDPELQGWIREIVKVNGLSKDSCVIVPCPQHVSGGGIGANAGYHGFSATARAPYIVFGVHGTNLTLADKPDVYAMALSHEIAEMTVDPRADEVNPEVCDPCCANCCDKFYRAYFAQSNKYLGTNQRTPPGGLPFGYYTAVVVRPSGITTPQGCAPKADCDYAPKRP